MSYPKFYAKVVWTVEDIKGLREDWSSKTCADWLAKNEKYIQARLIELGWEVIEALLPPRSERSCGTCCHSVRGACEYDGDCDNTTHPKWNRRCK
jgi:hypothetical protein